MAEMEEIELQKLRKALDRDVADLVDKYLKAWNGTSRKPMSAGRSG